MSIRPLPDEAIEKLRSSVTITSLNDTVINLVKNSLDAAATRLTLSVDYTRGSCSVEDDGHGIEPEEFLESGSLGAPHCTSRYPPSESFHGSHGNFLSSLAALSFLKITSKHHAHESSRVITFWNSVVLSRGTPASPDRYLRTSRHGTIVSVRNLFGPMPVRVKQRPLAGDKATLDKLFSHLVRGVVALVLTWPAPVSVSIKNSQGRSEVRLRPPDPTISTDSKLSAKVARTLVQSGLADDVSYGTWVTVGATSNNITVSGCISLNAVATQRVQFLSMGIRPFSNDHGRNVLYDEINQVFAASDFAGAGGSDDVPNSDSIAAKESKPKKRLERWPMFYLRIDRDLREESWISSAEDVLGQPRTIAVLTDLLKMISEEFLRKHHFRLRINSRQWQIQTRQPEKSSEHNVSNKLSRTDSTRSSSPRIRPESPFDSWQRIKVGRAAEASTRKTATKDSTVAPTITDSQNLLHDREGRRPPLVNKSGELLRRPFGHVEWPAPSQLSSVNSPSLSAKSTTPRGGEAAEKEQPSAALPRQSSSTRQQSQSRCLHGDTFEAAEPSDWLKNILSTWDNPTFEATERRIPRIDEAITAAKPGASWSGYPSTDSAGFDVSSVVHQGRLSKTSLSEAEVISQVDRKFILCKIGQDSGIKSDHDSTATSLVIVDQHAADERCKLEELMRNYFETDGSSGKLLAKSERIATPLRFEFGVRETTMLERYSAHFESWGIFFTATPAPESSQIGVIDVWSLPPSILERVRSEPKLLADLLRGEMWKLEEDGLPRTARPNREPTDWVANFQGCPQGILDMLNSRSCRSAVMFNDELNHEQCCQLIKDLSRCSFPFQCAHGRPSMAPLISLSTLSQISRGHPTEDDTGFGQKMRRMDQAQ